MNANEWSKLTDLQKSKSAQRGREWRARNRSANNEAHKARQKGRRRSVLKSKYGVSMEWYDEQVLAQGGVCYICNRPPGNKSLAVDHCHKTGKVRKLLCHKCNVSLGNANDDAFILNAMIEYLEEHNN